MDLGNLLKRKRIEMGYTLSAVAEAVSLSPGFLSQIENGITVPSIQSLRDILGFYNLPLSEFFRQMERKDIICVRANEVETIKGKKGVGISLLASKLEDNVLESYRVDLQSEESIQIRGSSIGGNGERFIYILSGVVEVRLPDDTFLLESGDSLNFKAYFSCNIRKSKYKTASFIINGTPQVL